MKYLLLGSLALLFICGIAYPIAKLGKAETQLNCISLFLLSIVMFSLTRLTTE